MTTLASAVLVACCITGAAPEQSTTDEEPAHRRYIRAGYLEYTYPGWLTLPATGAASSDVSLETHILRVNLPFGHFFKDSGFLLAGALSYDHLSVRNAAGSTPLHQLNLRLTLGGRVAPDWMLMVFGMPGIASDFTGFAERDLRLTVGALVRYGYRPELTFTFGALYTNGPTGHLGLPILHIHYRWRWLRFVLSFPPEGGLWFVPRPELELGVAFRFSGWLFGIHQPSDLGERFGGVNVHLGPAARVFLHRGLYLMTDCGWLVRYYRLARDGRDTHRVLEWAGGYVSVTLGYLL